MINYPFLQAKYYTTGREGNKVSWIFIHTMETPQTKNRALQVWRWFSGKTAPQASAHFMVDSTNIVQSIKLTDTAWAVDNYNVNQKSDSVELSGQAAQTPAQWADAYAKGELNLATKLLAQLCKFHGIPVRKATPQDINNNIPGIAGHWDVTIAKKIFGGHIDPGKNFPWTTFIPLVQIEFAKL